MKEKIASFSFSLIRHIGKEISNGRPIWALLFLSEYTKEKDRPLVEALKRRALGKIKESSRYDNIQALYSRLIAGETLNQFSDRDQMALRSFETIQPQSEKYFIVPSFSIRRSFPRRISASRQRSQRVQSTNNGLRKAKYSLKLS